MVFWYAAPPMATRALQVMVPDELLALIDNHFARVSALHPTMSVTRSALAREWLEQAFPMMEQRLVAMEEAKRAAMQQPPPMAPSTGHSSYIPQLKRGRPKR